VSTSARGPIGVRRYGIGDVDSRVDNQSEQRNLDDGDELDENIEHGDGHDRNWNHDYDHDRSEHDDRYVVVIDRRRL
jgi:hypothetical protein